jgi:hypothetical protein
MHEILSHLQPRSRTAGDGVYGVAVWRFAERSGRAGQDWYEAIIQPDFRVFRLVMPSKPIRNGDIPRARFTVYVATVTEAFTAGPPVRWEMLPPGVRSLCEVFGSDPYTLIRDPRYRPNVHLSVWRALEDSHRAAVGL